MDGTVSRRNFLKGSAAVAATSALSPRLAHAGSAAQRPNIIMILVDDLGYGFIGANGGISAHGEPFSTPNVDALAESGVRFTHGHSRAMCGPTRQSLMTGKSLMRYRNPPKEMPFIPEILRNAGYKTGIAGKWMMGPVYNPDIKGFDEACLQVGYYEFWDPKVMVFNSGGYLSELNQPADLERVPGGEWKTDCEVVDEYGEGCRTVLSGQFGPDVINRFARDFVERNASDPFFLYYAMKMVHVDYPQLPVSSEPGSYASAINYMDLLVGKITDTLETLGIRDNTLILFAGDNGHHCKIPDLEMVDEGQVCIPGKKGGSMEGSTRVPWIANWQGLNSIPRTCDDLVDIVDVLPTFVEAAGAALPEDEVFDGTSFLPQIKGETGNPREWIYIHAGHHPNPLSEQLADIYTELPAVVRYVIGTRYKLYGDGRFYDLETDMEETSPIELGSGSTEAEDARKLLQSVLNHYDDRTQWDQDKDFVEPELYAKAQTDDVPVIRVPNRSPSTPATTRSNYYDIRGRKVSPGRRRGRFELIRRLTDGGILLH